MITQKPADTYISASQISDPSSQTHCAAVDYRAAANANPMWVSTNSQRSAKNA